MIKKEKIHEISKNIFEKMSEISDSPVYISDDEEVYIDFGIKVTKTSKSMNKRSDVGNNIYYFKGIETNYVIEDTSSHADYKIIINKFILESILERLEKIENQNKN